MEVGGSEQNTLDQGEQPCTLVGRNERDKGGGGGGGVRGRVLVKTHIRIKEKVFISEERVHHFEHPHQLNRAELNPAAQL